MTNPRGETDLQVLLNTLDAQLQPEQYSFVTFKDATYGDHGALNPVACIVEKEGLRLAWTIHEITKSFCIPFVRSEFRSVGNTVRIPLLREIRYEQRVW